MKSMSQTLRLRLPGANGAQTAPADASDVAPSGPALAAPAVGGTALDRSIYGFILRHSLKEQIVVLVLTLASFPFLYYSLDLPKTIVNRAIGGKHFPETILGIELGQIPYLMTLCALFLALVMINGGFKYYINVYKGRIGERMLRRLRFELYHRLLRFPPGHFKKISPAEVIPMVTAELDPVGGFIGDAFALPLFQGGTLLTILFFMFVQDPILGTAAVALYPLQGYVIPKLQRKVRQLGKERVKLIRGVADRISESAVGMTEILANDGVRYQLSQFTRSLGRIYEVRFDIYNRKFFVKFLNNFINQLTPFFFFTIGGYLVIRGSLTFGALVAVLAAYKELAAPWKELLDFYQNQQDIAIKYEQVVEQFQPDGMADAQLQLLVPDTIPSLRGEIVLANISLVEDERVRILDGVSASFTTDEHVAIVGQSGSGKNELALVLARLMPPSGGRVLAAGLDLAGLPLAVVGRRIGYAGPLPQFFGGTLRDNLLYGLRTHPLADPDPDSPQAKRRRAALEEARKAGNIDLDPDADWIDLDAAGVADRDELRNRLVEVLERVGLDDDVYAFGLRGRIDPEKHGQTADCLLDARKALAQRLADEGLTHLVEPFDIDRYNRNASVAENLLFGTPKDAVFAFDALATNSYVLQVLNKVGLTEDLVHAGEQVAETMVELFADLPPDHEFFEQFSFIGANDLPEFQAILGRIAKTGRDQLKPDDRTRLLSLPFKLVLARHRLDVIDAPMQARLLEARKVFATDLPADLRDRIEFFDAGRYNAEATLQDNVLFGKIAYGEAEAPARIPALISSVLDGLGLRHAVIGVGLDYAVGSSGSRLSTPQRQKAAIARALIKRPEILVLNEATSALDGPTQAKVLSALKEECAGRGLVWVLHRASQARHFDRVIVMSGGKIAETGSFEALAKPGTTLTLLTQAE